MVYPMSEPSAAVVEPGPDFGYAEPFHGPNQAWANIFSTQKVATVNGSARIEVEPNSIFLVDRG